MSTAQLSGRELDAAVDALVFDVSIARENGKPFRLSAAANPDEWVVPRYSESIEAAMLVIEKLIADGGRVSMNGGLPTHEPPENVPEGGWHVRVYRFRVNVPPGTRFSFSAVGETLPEAICRAALAAIEGS